VGLDLIAKSKRQGFAWAAQRPIRADREQAAKICAMVSARASALWHALEGRVHADR